MYLLKGPLNGERKRLWYLRSEWKQWRQLRNGFADGLDVKEKERIPLVHLLCASYPNFPNKLIS